MNRPHQTPNCTVRTRVDYRSAPLLLLEDRRLSSDAKVLATWVLMHGNGWEFRIGYALKQTGIARGRWERRVRQELLEAGYFRQSAGRGTTAKGKQVMEWYNEITDEPLFLYQCTN